MATITVLKPDFEKPLAKEVSLAQRSIPNDPFIITLIDNGKPNARQLLENIAEKLKENIPIAEIDIHSNPSAGKPIENNEAQLMAARSRMVITGGGD